MGILLMSRMPSTQTRDLSIFTPDFFYDEIFNKMDNID